MTSCPFSSTLLLCKVCLYYSIICPLNTAWAIYLSAGRVSQTQQQEFANSGRHILPQRQILLALCFLRLQGQSCMNLTKATPSRAPTGVSWLSSGQLHLPPLSRARALALRPEYRGSRGIMRVRFSHFLPSYTRGSNGSELGIPFLRGKLMIQQVEWIHAIPVTHTFVRKTAHQ